jgi:hypothetical protein
MNPNSASGKKAKKTSNPLFEGSLERRLAGFRGRCWATYVLKRTGFSAPRANLEFSYDTGEAKQTKTLFQQYLRGERSPMPGIRGAYSYDMVAAVDRYLGDNQASRLLVHPMWTIFQTKVDGKALRVIMADLSEEGPSVINLGNFLPDPPGDLVAIKGTQYEPVIASFDDYVYHCAMFRLSIIDGYWIGYWQIHYLADHAAELDDTFSCIKEPFLKMVDDFYGKPDWLVKREQEAALEATA